MLFPIEEFRPFHVYHRAGDVLFKTTIEKDEEPKGKSNDKTSS